MKKIATLSTLVLCLLNGNFIVNAAAAGGPVGRAHRGGGVRVIPRRLEKTLYKILEDGNLAALKRYVPGVFRADARFEDGITLKQQVQITRYQVARRQQMAQLAAEAGEQPIDPQPDLLGYLSELDQLIAYLEAQEDK